MTVQRAIDALNRINKRLSVGEQYIPAYELKVLRKAHAKWTKVINEFTNPKAPARPLPTTRHQSQNTLPL